MLKPWLKLPYRYPGKGTLLDGAMSPITIIVLSCQVAALFGLALRWQINSARNVLRKTPVLVRTDASTLLKRVPVVDVVSIGSRTRWDYVQSQRSTWANHSSIRHFVGISEDDHEHHGSCEKSKASVSQCTARGKATRRQPPGISRKNFFINQSEGWFCAQKRPTVALGNVIANKYIPRGEVELPDWLILVDDDSIFHMDVFHLSVSHLVPDHVHVLAGSHIFAGGGLDWPHGGNGVAMSRGAIRRLFEPLSCQGKIHASDGFQQHACATLRKNKAYELDEFVEGMSIADLMLEIVDKRKPFCWHSDWMTGW
eukprot:CAMPEP_0172559682 /NCGR_PEP_ID=MMETSP1067-20121228/85270_1 /TAXON_ID=265564 ORGANISM="Thalassiosira punctigera, Strain Tpunct2005C2" /NCGR_SAMPLE_ID=MMETSP1067 /ASSEMBLY_ACC=CAM_ASM_000444 /LENGTH=311 /DNA_ID=CAMNT_0013349335 /DNA_START=42 /DNA_END=974 /DNA_ORIENTATION=+